MHLSRRKALALLLAATVPQLPRMALAAAPEATSARDTHIRAAGLWLRLRRRVDPAAARAPEAAVLFVHGAVFPGVPTFDLTPTASWLTVALAHGLDPYLLDLDGYGESMPPLGGDACSLDRAVADVAAAVEAMTPGHPQGVALVGYDYGADVAALYASRHPVSGLVLVAPLQAAGPFRDERTMTAARLRAWLGSGVPGSVAERAITMALLGTRGAGFHDPPALVIPEGVLESLGGPPVSPALVAGIAAPTLLVRGRLDTVFDHAAAAELAGAAPRLHRVEVDGGHHLPWEDGGRQTAEEVAAFLSATGTAVH